MDLDAMNKEALYALAQEHNLAGRSTMSASELRTALGAILATDDSVDDAHDAKASRPVPYSRMLRRARIKGR